MKKVKPIVNNIKRYRKSNFFKAKFIYTKYYNRKLNEKQILLESFNGSGFTGNPFYILLELCNNPKYSKFEKYVALNKADVEKVQNVFKRCNILKKVKIVIRHTKQYCKLLAQAKYLVNNVTFPTYYIKKEGQIYLNTWHGTPLKGLGRNINNNPHSIGNVQRNFLSATHLLFPNQYTFDCIRNDYMIEQFYQGEYILTGYPRNDIFFNKKQSQEMREKLEVEDKKVVVYMPTWRDKVKGDHPQKNIIYLMHTLLELEEKIEDDTVVFVKMHHLANGHIDLEQFTKIRPFPNEYETYEVLNMADGLITDYSSVMFDFTNTGKKVMLYTYDKEEYMAGRSMYFSIDDLPYEATDDIDVLCQEIKNISVHADYKTVEEKFCTYDYPNATRDLCEYIFNGKKNDRIKVIEGQKYHNNKKNILIYAGDLLKNGITTALKALLVNIDLKENNYVLTFYKRGVEKNKQTINEFNTDLSYIPMTGEKNLSKMEAICQYLYYRLNIQPKFVKKGIDSIYKREFYRCFCGIKFDIAIHYTGYERQIIHLLRNSNADIKILYTHNNLMKEYKTRKNIHLNSLLKAQDEFDRIAIIRETMKREIIEGNPNVKENKIYIAHNFNDIKGIIEKSNNEIEVDQDTYCNYTTEELKRILEDKSCSKFINIARFSKEKGLERLIDAFVKYREKNPNTYLIIIGGHGNEFKKIKNKVIDNNIENVIIIRNLHNPFPILKRCDAFILSSFYEGLPMVIMEALILKIPVISTNITGPKEFLKQGYGYLVDNSEEGLIEGMKAFEEGKLNTMKKFDAEQFNREALEEFENIIK